MKKTLLSTVLIGATLLSANSLEEIKLEGKSAIMQMGETLQAQVKKNMKSGGVLQAANFCTKEAVNLEKEVNASFKNGVSVKRVSLKPRNPNNAPSADERAVLEQIQNDYENKKAIPKLIVKEVSKDNYKVYKPIFLNNNACLACHGTTQVRNAKAYEIIKAKYPNDKAIDYKSGDFRGAFISHIKK